MKTAELNMFIGSLHKFNRTKKPTRVDPDMTGETAL